MAQTKISSTMSEVFIKPFGENLEVRASGRNINGAPAILIVYWGREYPESIIIPVDKVEAAIAAMRESVRSLDAQDEGGTKE